MTKFNSDLAGQMNERAAKMDKFREAGVNPFANSFKISNTIQQANTATGDLPSQADILATDYRYSLAGRLIQIGDFGKIKFLFIRGDNNQIIQGLVRKIDTPELYELTRDIQVGDFIGFSGPLFLTKQQKRAILVEGLQLLTKSIRPLPGKVLQEEQDVNDIELLYRRRYLDFIQHPEKIDVFKKRAKIISTIRACLDHIGYTEVETRMMLSNNGGAAARPFKTHHNTLDKEFNLRIAPELDLKRLIVGGFEKVYELGRQFRNEGMDRFHNPEFTSIEFYEAYSNYRTAMNSTEYLLRLVAVSINASKINYQGTEIDFKAPFARKTMLEAVQGVVMDRHLPDDCRYGMKLVQLFEEKVEPFLIQPTFITQYPIEASPLARRNDNDPRFTDRFELFICGKEIANGFSELNDPVDQYNRFAEQVKQKDAGNLEAMDMDQDYIEALQYGMPPCAGVGIGIDRLVMLLTDQASIRDVILFPQMR